MMNTKRWLMGGFSAILAAALLTGCGEDTSSEPAKEDVETEETDTEIASETAEAGKYEDGIYFAQEDGFGDSGWKYMATLEIKDGKIVSAEWNGANKAGGVDKIT